MPEGGGYTTGVCDEGAVVPDLLDFAGWGTYASQCFGRGIAVTAAIALHNIPGVWWWWCVCARERVGRLGRGPALLR